MRKEFWSLMEGEPATPAPAAPATPAAPAAAATPTPNPPATPPAVPATPAAPAAVSGDWPADWQQRIAGDDKDELKQLGRYASPKAVWEKARALERRLSSGELKAALPKDAKPEEIAAWRKDNGVPEKPEAYDIKLASGEKITKEQKPVIDAFLASAHGANLTNEQASVAVDSYLSIQKQQQQHRAEKDEEQRVTALDALNKEFGGAFRRNINVVDGLLSKLPESVRDQFKSARLPDGTALFNNVDVVRGFLAIALENNPAGVIAPAGGGDLGKTAMEEYKGIQKSMRDNRTAYNKDSAKQLRFTELIGYLTKQGLIDQNGNEIVQKRAA